MSKMAKQRQQQSEFDANVGALSKINLPDVIVIAPPWGGPDFYYAADGPFYDVEERIRCPLTCSQWIALALTAAPCAILMVPRSASVQQLREIAPLGSHNVVVERVHLNYKPKMTVAYYCSGSDSPSPHH